ncbi:hypothetical protein ACKUEM_26100, partial [Escherichia coli]
VGPSFLELFLLADPFTKAIMILLLLASIWSWAVIIDKSFRLMRLVRKGPVTHEGRETNPGGAGQKRTPARPWWAAGEGLVEEAEGH